MDQPPRRSTLLAYWIGLALAVVMTAAGGYLAYARGNWTVLAIGSASVLAVMLTWPLAEILESMRSTQLKDLDARLADLHERLEQFSVMINLMSEQQLISDRAKSVAFREKEREALRRAIQEEMGRQDWEAALVLANEIERSFGYKAEADRFRGEINAKHNEVIRKQINEAIAGIDRHIRAENWQIALREAERLQQVYPADDQVASLPKVIEQRRAAHKRQLLESLHDSINRHDNDGALEILKKVDGYLTPEEAQSMQESARHVFKEKLANLRTKFAVAHADNNAHEMIRIAEEIMTEFPNSKMAEEVREMMPALQVRANTSAVEPARV